MLAEFNGAEIFRDALYSWDTWIPALKLMVPIVIADVVLLILKALLKALARFIGRIIR